MWPKLTCHLQGKSISLSFPASTSNSWLMAPSSTIKIHSIASPESSLCVCLFLALTSPSQTPHPPRRTSVIIEVIPVIQHDLPISHHLSFILSIPEMWMKTQGLETGNDLSERLLFLQPQIPKTKAQEMNQTLGDKIKC